MNNFTSRLLSSYIANNRYEVHINLLYKSELSVFIIFCHLFVNLSHTDTDLTQ